MRTEMTFEEAVKYADNPYKDYTSINEEDKQKVINTQLKDWNYHLEDWNWSKENTLKELEKAVKVTGDDIELLDVRFEKQYDYAARQGYEIKFNAWSERYVYVRGVYDGSTWVVAIERNPSDNLVEPIGGG